MSRLFISHSSKDNVAAVAFKQWLCAIGWQDDDVFLDLDSIGAGERWKDALNKANARCEGIILLASPEALFSPECIIEVRKAEDVGKEIIVVLLRDIQFDDHRLDSYKDRQIVDLAAPPQTHVEAVEYRGEHHEVPFNAAGLARIRDFLSKRGITPDRFAWPPKLRPDAEPFPGLSAFTEDDAGIFFGRDADIIRGLDKLRLLRRNGRPRLLVIQAASGAGKSSYLRAGVWPRLDRDPDFATLAILRPAQGILTGPEGLGRKLAARLSRPAHLIGPGQIHVQLTAPSAAAAAASFSQLMVLAATQALEQRLVSDPEARTPALALAVDQAEELFGADDKAESDRFLLLLAHFMRETPAGAEPFCLFTVRSDGAARLFQTIADIGLEVPDTLPLLPLPQTAYREVVLKPLDLMSRRGQRLTLSPALADRLVADSTGGDALPLLAFTISHLYREFSVTGSLTLDQYESIGGVAGSIDMALKQALAKPADAPAIPANRGEQFALLRTTFIPWLARVDPETGVPMRRIAQLDEFAQGSRSMIERLVKARLLVADRRSGTDVVEVAHESLLRQWPALTAWLQADADDLKLVDAIERAAGEWARNGRQDGWLDHRAERLGAAERIVAREDFRKRLAEDGVAYLQACRTREEADRAEKEAMIAREQVHISRTRVLQKRAGAALGILAAVVVGFLGFANWQYRSNLARQAELDRARSDLTAEQDKSNRDKVQLDRAQINLIEGLASSEALRGHLDSALRFAIHAEALDQRLGGNAANRSLAPATLAATVRQSDWRLMLSGHEFGVTSAAFSPDGTRIVTASNDKTARIWDATNGREIAVLRGHEGWVTAAAFSPDGTRIVTGSWDSTARIWDATGGREIAVLQHDLMVFSVGFSPDSARIVTASKGGTARIWDVARGEQIATLSGHEEIVSSVAFSPDGTRVVTASVDRTARIWDAANSQQIALLRHESYVNSAAFSPDGKRVVTASVDGTARIWDATTTKQIAVLNGHEALRSAAFSPDGKRIVTASEDKTARIWDATTAKEVAVLRGHEGILNSAAFGPDGARIVTASDDVTARLWDAVSGEAIAVLRGHMGGRISSAAFSPDGMRIVTASYDRSARIWEATSTKEIAVLRGHEDRVTSAAFSPNGTRIVTASEDKTARIWDAVTGEEIEVLRHGSIVFSAAFSFDGMRIVTASGSTARVWDAATTKEVAVLRGHEGMVYSAAFSPDGTRIVTGSQDKTARVWDGVTGQPVAVLRGSKDYVKSVAFSPDGSRIVTVSGLTARIWDAATAKEMVVLRGHESYVNSAAFSPDGTRVVTASDDKTARIWDSESGQEVAVLRGHEFEVSAAAFSPDRKRIVTASEDNTVRLWDVHFATMSAKDLVAEACMRRLLGLTTLSHDEMRLAGYPDETPEIDVCAGIAQRTSP